MTEIKITDPKTLETWLASNDCVLIDVREPFEYNEVCIVQAINIPLSQLLVKINEAHDLKNKKIVVHCKAGIRSMMGCQALEKDGFTGVLWNLEGGIQSWMDAGLPVISKK